MTIFELMVRKKYLADGKTVDFKVVIFFPWDPEHKLFKGEIMYIDRYHELMERPE